MTVFHLSSSDQYLILGAEEGIYTLNLNELHEDTLEKVHDGRTRVVNPNPYALRQELGYDGKG